MAQVLLRIYNGIERQSTVVGGSCMARGWLGRERVLGILGRLAEETGDEGLAGLRVERIVRSYWPDNRVPCQSMSVDHVEIWPPVSPGHLGALGRLMLEGWEPDLLRRHTVIVLDNTQVAPNGPYWGGTCLAYTLPEWRASMPSTTAVEPSMVSTS